MNGLADERGRIVDIDVIDARWKVFLELGHLMPDFLLHLDDIGARRGDDPEGGGIIAVRIRFGAIVQRAQLDMPDDADAGDTTLGVRLYDDVAKLFGCG